MREDLAWLPAHFHTCRDLLGNAQTEAVNGISSSLCRNYIPTPIARPCHSIHRTKQSWPLDHTMGQKTKCLQKLKDKLHLTITSSVTNITDAHMLQCYLQNVTEEETCHKEILGCSIPGPPRQIPAGSGTQHTMQWASWGWSWLGYAPSVQGGKSDSTPHTSLQEECIWSSKIISRL